MSIEGILKQHEDVCQQYESCDEKCYKEIATAIQEYIDEHYVNKHDNEILINTILGGKNVDTESVRRTPKETTG